MTHNHVFVARGDISKLRCSAWLLPTDKTFTLNERWIADAPPNARSELQSLRESNDLRLDVNRCLAIRPWYPGLGDAPAPIPILTDTGGIVSTELEWYLEGITEFIKSALSLSGEQRTSWRDRPLFALPLIGSGLGGWSRKKGALADAILKHVNAELSRDGRRADAILVLSDDVAFAAAQSTRSDSDWTKLLDPELLRVAERLSTRARRGDLVIFLGAGISKKAGLPLWPELISDLSSDFTMSSAEADELAKLANLDGASAVESRTSPKLFREAIAARFSSSVYGLPHALLAGMKLKEAVTTNYDSLYETACIAAGHRISTLPYDPEPNAAGWLLKLHGCTEHPDDIVITRRDYLRYQNSRAALYGIVQAMLITRHMLFLGFSLTDDNFHVLIDEVRRAIDGEGAAAKNRRAFGTAIALRSGYFAKDLWTSDIDLIQMASFVQDDLGAARLTEVFLDYVAFKAILPTEHFFDETYETALTESDRIIKLALEQLLHSLGDDLLAEHAVPIAEMFHAYGLPHPSIRDEGTM